MKEVKLSECGLSYAVVSIMGPQSSGKVSCPHTFISSSSPHSFVFPLTYKYNEMCTIPDKQIFLLSNLLFSLLCAGKSTLLNNLFHTNFREMDAFKGRYDLAILTYHISLAQITGR